MSTAAEYNATINWGDSSSSPPPPVTITLTGTSSSGNDFAVKGDHTYTEEGTYTVRVTITDVDNLSNTATATSTARVVDAPLHSSCAAAPVSTQSFSGPTATFTDNNAFATKADFSATINWGDSTSSSGTISGGPGVGPYTVSGSHTYTSTGPFTVTTTINDDGGSTTTTPGCSVLVFAFATEKGAAFVIGDLEAGLAKHVTWWSSQWANINLMSGGAPPDAMKGFAGFEDNFLGLPPPNCGGTWSTDPGNSTPPPPSVPAFMGVIVSSKVTKSGSVISGDIKQVVIVRNDPGYAPSPGHPGTGTEIAIVCVSP
jgi:PKD repeat protein